jgi:emfourin
MGTLKIERVGGLAGFGIPGSRIKSSGEVAIAALSAADQAQVETLFKDPTAQQQAGLESLERDAFRYRITRVKDGKEQTVEASEAAVPHAIKSCVTDKLR